MEELKLRNPSGIAKLTGVALCLAGVFVIAFYTGELLSAVNHHHAFASHASSGADVVVTRSAWVKWTFLMVLANTAWSLWIVLQVSMSSSSSYLFTLQSTLWTYGFLQHAVELAIFGLISRLSLTLFQ